MSNDYFKKEGKKGYNKEEVDAFLENLNKTHLEGIMEKDAEIKQLFAQNSQLKSKIAEKTAEVQGLVEQLEALKAQKDEEAVRLNARIGEKLSAAEDAAKAIIDEANAQSDVIRQNAQDQAARLVAEAKERITRYCEKARKVADIYEEKQHLVSSGIEQARRHLDQAAANVEKILTEILE